ncbi:MAG: transcription antitermination factor NusB [Bacteroidetes bacterium]|nr:MAG: transcription antitermination factor NusB [Bacteroidota bacterium]
MFSRRQLRIRVMQALYAFGSQGGVRPREGVKELLRSIDKAFELYCFLLLLLKETYLYAVIDQDLRMARMVQSEEDKNPNDRFIENKALTALAEHKRLDSLSNKLGLIWNPEDELPKKIFSEFKESEQYQAYLVSETPSIYEDIEIAITLFRSFVVSNELVLQIVDERSVYWESGVESMTPIVVGTIKSFKNSNWKLQPRKIDKEDEEFIKMLFETTLENEEEYARYIGDKSQNWDTDRIAAMDILLMKMALAEILNFSEIPIKVSMNEYIELSKQFSAPQSKSFINGILDKLVTELSKEKKIVKTGKGLKE